MHILPKSPSDGLFGLLTPRPADALLGLIAAFAADGRPAKIDLGVGVFRDDEGRTPVMGAVKRAESLLLLSQSSKAYLGIEGDSVFTDLLAHSALGTSLASSSRLTGIQTPGGTGALRLGAELIAQVRPGATVWVGEPSWPNHVPLMRAAGLRVSSYTHYDVDSSSLHFDEILAALEQAGSGDVLLLHGCCHNPTGASFDEAQWDALIALCLDKGLIPFFDLAYQGLGDGLEADAASVRRMLAVLPEALVAYSCDKNFGLYRDRVGALWVQSASQRAAAVLQDNVRYLARVLWSMPPDHGAAVVRIILEKPDLRSQWLNELDAIRARINTLRNALGAAHPALGPIARQRGMFALLPIAPGAPEALRLEHGIYMAGNGRINISGLREDAIPRFASAVAPHLSQKEGS